MHVMGIVLQWSLRAVHFLAPTSNLKVIFEIVGVGHVSRCTISPGFFAQEHGIRKENFMDDGYIHYCNCLVVPHVHK